MAQVVRNFVEEFDEISGLGSIPSLEILKKSGGSGW